MDEDVFVITGDIHAMWLRDSSCQVVHYIDFADRYPGIQKFIRNLIIKQFKYIRIDPYANAFMRDTGQKSKYNDKSNFTTKWNWERKYELDSLCYPVWLLYKYYSVTKDRSVFSEELKDTLYLILSVWKTEQNHEEESEYFFERSTGRATDTLPNSGRGTKTVYTGMTWSGFRPSDDACLYGYLIPSNMFAVIALRYIEDIAENIYGDEILEERARKLRADIRKGILEYGIYRHEIYGYIYAYETDGRGNYNLMDDANVPSLLSLPWLGYCDIEDPVYQNTRRFILSEANPYYYVGSFAKGIGSPHTPEGYIWPIALIMEGLTTTDRDEQTRILQTLMSTDAGTGYMHESFCCDDPGKFTRSWFAWANSLFANFIMEYFSLRDMR